MILTEYDEQEVMNGFKEEGRLEGRIEVMSGMLTLIERGFITAEDAASALKITVEEFWTRAKELNLLENTPS